MVGVSHQIFALMFLLSNPRDFLTLIEKKVIPGIMKVRASPKKYKTTIKTQKRKLF